VSDFPCTCGHLAWQHGSIFQDSYSLAGKDHWRVKVGYYCDSECPCMSYRADNLRYLENQSEQSKSL
jgi:hypothetical protein